MVLGIHEEGQGHCFPHLNYFKHWPLPGSLDFRLLFLLCCRSPGVILAEELGFDGVEKQGLIY